MPHATEILASDAAKSLFDTLQIKYDYVIVDLAPLVAGVDVRATSRLIDSYVLVIEWGATKIDAVQYALRHAPGVQENIVGVVLNKVNMAAMGRYDSYGADIIMVSLGTGLSALTMLHFDVGSRALAGNERWFLAHTQPKSERKAELHLGAQGFRTYLPQIQKTIRHARQLRTVQAPLFPRYLFVILDLERDRWLSVRSTVGVSRLFTIRMVGRFPFPLVSWNR